MGSVSMGVASPPCAAGDRPASHRILQGSWMISQPQIRRCLVSFCLRTRTAACEQTTYHGSQTYYTAASRKQDADACICYITSHSHSHRRPSTYPIKCEASLTPPSSVSVLICLALLRDISKKHSREMQPWINTAHLIYTQFNHILHIRAPSARLKKNLTLPGTFQNIKPLLRTSPHC